MIESDRRAPEEGLEVLALSGSLDAQREPALRSMLREKIEAHCPALILDMSDVDYIDSGAVAALVEYRREASKYGGKFFLTGLRDGLRSNCDIAEIERSIPTYRTVAEANAALVRDGLQQPG